jgi:hypothetical protein
MLYIVRRTQLYLEEDLWNALHERARRQGTTISDLVRKAAREQYMSLDEDRRAAMEGIVGLWKDRTDLPDTETYVRGLRKDTRRKRLGIE